MKCLESTNEREPRKTDITSRPREPASSEAGNNAHALGRVLHTGTPHLHYTLLLRLLLYTPAPGTRVSGERGSLIEYAHRVAWRRARGAARRRRGVLLGLAARALLLEALDLALFLALLLLLLACATHAARGTVASWARAELGALGPPGHARGGGVGRQAGARMPLWAAHLPRGRRSAPPRRGSWS